MDVKGGRPGVCYKDGGQGNGYGILYDEPVTRNCVGDDRGVGLQRASGTGRRDDGGHGTPTRRWWRRETVVDDRLVPGHGGRLRDGRVAAVRDPQGGQDVTTAGRCGRSATGQDRQKDDDRPPISKVTHPRGFSDSSVGLNRNSCRSCTRAWTYCLRYSQVRRFTKFKQSTSLILCNFNYPPIDTY